MKYQIRITFDETFEVEAENEEEAEALAWDELLQSGAWGQEIKEVEEEA